jgi:hypothetical protein
MSALKAKTHHVFQIYLIGAYGQRSEPTEHRIHVSRSCASCAHDGRRNAEWTAEGGVEKYGICMNGCGAAEDPIEANQWCDSHATQQEWVAGVSRIDRPALGVVEGGAA